MRKDIALDMGGSALRIFQRGRGLIYDAPAMAAMSRENGSLMEVGREAADADALLPGIYDICYPLTGSLYDRLEMTVQMAERLLRKNGLIRSRIILTVPSDLTEEEQKALLDRIDESGLKKIYLVDETVAAVMGSGTDVFLPNGTLVLHIGATRSVVGMVSMGTLTQHQAVGIGARDFCGAIQAGVEEKHHIHISEDTARKLMVRYGGGLRQPKNRGVRIVGCSLRTGLPKKRVFTSDETADAMEEPLTEIIRMVCAFLEDVHTDYQTDIDKYGLLLTGGGAQAYGLSEIFHEMTGLKVRVAQDPANCAVIGASKFYEKLPMMSGEVNLTRSANMVM